jgi:FixJ family two-component response regulator
MIPTITTFDRLRGVGGLLSLVRNGRANAVEALRPKDLGVVVVDDEESIVRHLAAGLARLGYRVMPAHDAAEVVRLVGLDPTIGVVVSDVRMPERDGISLAEHLLAADNDAEALAVILITGHATLADAAAAIRARASDFLRKPFRLAEVVSAVDVALDRVFARRQRAAANLRRQRELQTVQTEAASLQAQLDAAIARLRCLPMLKRPEMIALSHALRTPLNAIAGGATLLGDGKHSSEADREYLALLRQGVRDALESVELVEEWHRLALPRPAVASKIEVRLDWLLEAALSRQRAAAAEAGVTLGPAQDDARALPCEAALLEHEAALLERALELVLKAAIATASAGGRVVMEINNAQSGWVLTVIARGGREAEMVAIPPDRAFPAAASAVPAEYETLGIAVARRCVELLDGTLTSWAGIPGIVAYRLALFSGDAEP